MSEADAEKARQRAFVEKHIGKFQGLPPQSEAAIARALTEAAKRK